MRTLLIGAQGQLGRDLQPVLGPECVGLDWPEIDVARPEQVRTVVQAMRPAVVVNCAAHTHVDQCEDQPDLCYRVNALGAGYVAAAAQACGARLVYLSTDYVFGAAGPRATPYTEDDLPGPLGHYGVAKLAGEHLSRALCARTLVVRTCGLYGHAGARGKGGNFVETMLRLGRAGEPLRVVDDQVLSPTSTVACAARIAALLARDAVGVVHVAAADACSWHAFACEIFRLAGLAVTVQAVTSAEYVTRARRPAYSALGSARGAELGLAPLPGWRAMLAEYLRARPEATAT